jgi:hypothetical protein
MLPKGALAVFRHKYSNCWRTILFNFAQFYGS